MSDTDQHIWQYKPEYSYEANMSNWIDNANYERSRHDETRWTQDQAEMKFMEMYPRSEYGKT